ncbi:MAG: PIG-L family deacetylase [Waddliaceae bacterium]
MVDILAFGAHPDDIEFFCGAILAKMAAQRRSIVMADLTLGEKGSHGTAEERRKEGEDAACLIGASRVFLDFKDCEIVDTYGSRLELVKVIREFRPRLVLAPMWKGEQDHPDHLAAGRIARYACRYARFSKILPEIPIHRVEGILHYPSSFSASIDFIVDVSEHVEVWMKMIRCHAGQLKTFSYDDWHLRIASRLGMLINRPYAQGLVKGNPIVIEDLMQVAQGVREI